MLHLSFNLTLKIVVPSPPPTDDSPDPRLVMVYSKGFIFILLILIFLFYWIYSSIRLFWKIIYYTATYLKYAVKEKKSRAIGTFSFSKKVFTTHGNVKLQAFISSDYDHTQLI